MIIFNFKFRDMKKQVLMMAALALALGGCSKTETTGSAQGGVIGFAGSGVNNITKAGDLDNDSFTKFYVYGGYQGTDGAPVTRFNGVEVTKADDKWTYSPIQYWAEGTWAFGAYGTSAAISNVSEVNWDYTDGLTFTVNSDNDNQGDVVYADATEIPVDDASTYSTPVHFTFKHLLSKIQFKFTKGDNVKAYTVNLYDFKLENVITDGTWTKGVWALGATATVPYTTFASETAIDDANGLGAGPFYVVPQGVPATGAASTFDLTFKAKVTDGTTIYKDGTVKVTLPQGNWVAQNVYQYSAVINMENIDDPDHPDEDLKPIEFTVTVEEGWTQGNNEDVTLPDVTEEP